ncbi:ABC transporter ATP-binding protein [bacterium]|nr:ABC transporter ATP-binding protein [bacterium]
MKQIELVNLSKQFVRGEETIEALRAINLTVNSGDFISVTGASGSGKSTLLHIIGLLDRASTGDYFLNGINTVSLNDPERAQLRNTALGFIFQSFFLLPKVSALRNVTMPLVYHGGISIKDQKMRAEEALLKVGLQDRMKHLPNELSGGQRQRVAIARAIVNHPQILLADEPTGNLDFKTGRSILALFNTLNQEGMTILMVTHDAEIAQYGKRQITFFDGLMTVSR